MIRVANLKTSRPFILTWASGIVEVARARAREPEVFAAAPVRAELEARGTRPARRAPSRPRRRRRRRARASSDPPSRGSWRARRRRRRGCAARGPTRACRTPARARRRTRAAGEEVVGGGFRHPELVGEERRGRREHHVRRHRRADQEVDVARLDAGVGKRRARRGPGDVGERLLLARRCGARECPSARGSTRRRCPRSRASSSLVRTRSGTCVPRPVIPIRSAGRRADH